MRTTVTLDKDVERLLREEMHRSRSGFKQALNAGIRAGLSQKRAPAARRPFVLKARPLGLRAGLDPASFNKLADDLEVDAFLGQSRKRRPKRLSA
ncbi:MAG: antitoxin [Bryobacteraceae bacterium]